MTRVVVSKEDDLDGVEAERTGECSRLTDLPMLGGSVVILGRPDFVFLFQARLDSVHHMPEVREHFQKLLEENKLMNEALSRVQARCTELLMENRAVLRNPGEIMVAGCGTCPVCYYSEAGGEAMCSLKEGVDCLPGDVPDECPLKYKPVTLRVSD